MGTMTLKALGDKLDASAKSAVTAVIESSKGGDGDLQKGLDTARNSPAIITGAKVEPSKDAKELSGRYLQTLLAAGAKSETEIMNTFQKHYRGDEKLEKALSSSDFSAGGAAVGSEMATSIIELLRPATVVRQAGPTIAQMAQGTIELPKQTAGSTGAYVGENQTGGSSQPSTGSLVLTKKKLKVEIPFSNDFTRFAVINGAQFIQNDAVQGLSRREDAAFLRDDGTSQTPMGLRFWVPTANVFDASGDADTLATIEVKLRQMEEALRGANVGMVNPYWFFSSRTWGRLFTIRTGASADGLYAFRDEMRGGTLQGHPFLVSNQIPNDLGAGTESEVYLVDMVDAVIGEALDMQVDVFPGGAYHDGTAVRSGISRDQTVLRVIMQHDFGMRHDESVSVSSGVKWGA